MISVYICAYLYISVRMMMISVYIREYLFISKQSCRDVGVHARACIQVSTVIRACTILYSSARERECAYDHTSVQSSARAYTRSKQTRCHVRWHARACARACVKV